MITQVVTKHIELVVETGIPVIVRRLAARIEFRHKVEHRHLANGRH